MDKSSETFQRLSDYVQNTHAATHRMYDLEVAEVSLFRYILLCSTFFYSNLYSNKANAGRPTIVLYYIID